MLHLRPETPVEVKAKVAQKTEGESKEELPEEEVLAPKIK